MRLISSPLPGAMPTVRTTLALVLLAAACGGSSKNTAVGNGGGPVGPLGPVPTISFDTTAGDWGEFRTSGLPAVSHDGTRVLIERVDNDGGRGAPNLTLAVRDRADAKVAEYVVLTADSAAGSSDDSGEIAPAKPDVTAANAWLADQHRSAAFTVLAPGTVDSDSESILEQTRWSVAVGDATITLDQDAKLVVVQGGKPVLSKTMSAWIAPSYPMYPNAPADEQCSNPHFVDAAYIDPAHKLALLRVAYTGTDSCWEPASELHVVAW